jgi:hypothetical protein
MYNAIFAVILAIGLGVLHLNGISLLTNRSAAQFWEQREFRAPRILLIASIASCALAVYSFFLSLAVSGALFLGYTALSVRQSLKH